MSLTSDALLARVLMRRRLIIWRILALAFFVVIICMVGWGSGANPQNTSHVAVVNISGVILDDAKRDAMFDEIAKSQAKAVILQINSPGGGVTASEKLYDAIRQLNEKKPVVALVEQVAASGGYIAAMGAERIVAYRTSITGSIGVLVQYPNVTGLLGKIGVDMEAIKSSPLKASPNGFEPTSPEARDAIRSVVMDNYGWFKGLVSERRHITGEALNYVSDGRVFSGSQALDLKLIDAIGSKKDIREWLEEKHKVSKDLKEHEWKPSEGKLADMGLAKSSLAFLLETVGLPNWAAQVRSQSLQAIDIYALDGILAIWHPVEK